MYSGGKANASSTKKKNIKIKTEYAAISSSLANSQVIDLSRMW